MSNPGRLGAGRLRRVLGGVVMAALLAVPLSGCGAGVLAVGSRAVSACYRAIPVAVAAAGDPRARLVGVHRLPEDLALRVVSIPARPRRDLDTAVCVVALRGSFLAGAARSAPNGQVGRFAVVLVTSRSLRLVGSWVLDRLPRHLLGRTY
jgi:hypothetical protein